MPFKSEKQRRYMHANLPEIAKRWERDYANGGIARVGLANGSFLESLGLTPAHNIAVTDMKRNPSKYGIESQFDYAAESAKDMVNRAAPGNALTSAIGNVVGRPIYDFIDAAKEYSKKGYQGEFSFTPQGAKDFYGNLKSFGKEFLDQKPHVMMAGAAKGGLEALRERLSNLNFGSSAQAASPNMIRFKKRKDRIMSQAKKQAAMQQRIREHEAKKILEQEAKKRSINTLGPNNPLIGKIDHTGGGGHGSITRAPGSKGPKGTPTHRTRDDLMAQGGRVPFQDAGLATLPYPNYFELPPVSGSSPYKNTWTFPTGEEEQITTSSTGEGSLPASYKGYPSYEAWLAAQRSGGDVPGQVPLGLTYAEGPASGTTDFNINPAAFLTGKGRLDPMGSDMDYFLNLPQNQKYSFGVKDKNLPGFPGYEAPSKYFEEPSLIDKGIGSIKDFFSGLGTKKRRGTLGDRALRQYQFGQKLPSFLSGIVGAQSPFNEKSRNYNKDFVDQLNFLEMQGQPGGYIGIDPRSGLRKYGPESVLSGQNVFSGWGSNDYAEQLQKQLAKYRHTWKTKSHKWDEAKKKRWKKKFLEKGEKEEKKLETGMTDKKKKKKIITTDKGGDGGGGIDKPHHGDVAHGPGGRFDTPKHHGDVAHGPGGRFDQPAADVAGDSWADSPFAQGGIASLWPR